MKNQNPLPRVHDYHDQGAGENWHGPMVWPRRACIDQYAPAEKAVRAAMLEVEKLGADLLLTHAEIKLQEAQALIADWLEGKVGELDHAGKLLVLDPSGVQEVDRG